MSKLNTQKHIDLELRMDDLDLKSSEKKATYQQIKDYIVDKHGLKVSTLYISQIKRKSGLEVGENYNVSKKRE